MQADVAGPAACIFGHSDPPGLSSLMGVSSTRAVVTAASQPSVCSLQYWFTIREWQLAFPQGCPSGTLIAIWRNH